MPRDLTVRVRADVGAYQKAMSAAASSTDQFAQSGMRLQKVGMRISGIGDSLTKNVTLPLALAGGAAIKMATDFDKSFTTMQTLAGVSSSSVDSLKESVLDLAGETGKAPQELADALYFLSSSGLDADAAMEALKASAKASAVGLGDTAVVADAVSSAMLGYAKSGLTAAEATDVLIATARAGKAEPAELAGQMGRLIPIASELGISFDQVGGAIAALSTKGNSAEMATTQLVNVMSKLLKPSEQAATLLDSVGLSADGVRKMLAEKGLLGTLEELRARLGESGFTKFLEDTQAIQGGLALLGGDLNKTKDIFDQVKESAGATENAFSKWAESMGAQNARAFAEFQVALIRIGEVLAPIASDVLNFVSKLAEAFSNLPEGVQQGVIAFAALAAAMGPILSVTGRVITALGTALRLLESFALPAGSVAGAFNNTTVAAGGLSSALGAAGVAGALLAVSAGFALFLKSKNDAQIAEAAEEFAQLENVSRRTAASVLELNDAVKVSTTDFTAGKSAAQEFAESGELTGQAMKDLDERFDSLLDKAPEMAQSFIDNAREIGVSREKLAEWQGALEEQIGTEAEAKAAQEEYNDAVDAAAGVTEEATSALKEYAEALAAQFDPLFGMQSALSGLEEAQLGVQDAQAKLNEAMAGGDPTAIAEAQRNYDAALRGASGALYDVQTAQLILNDAIDAGDVSLEDAQQQMFNWAIQAGFTESEAYQMAAGLGTATQRAQELGQQNPVVNVRVTGVEQSINDIKAIQDRINALHGRDVGIRIVGTAVGAVGGGVFRMHEGGVVPGRRGEEVAAVLQAGETVLPLDTQLRSVPAMAGGGGTVVVNVDMRGAIVSSETQFRRMVTRSANQALASGEINLRGRRIA